MTRPGPIRRGCAAFAVAATAHLSALAGPIDGCADFTQCTAALASNAAAIVQVTFSDLHGGYALPPGYHAGLNEHHDFRTLDGPGVLVAAIGELCLNCAASSFHSSASGRAQSGFGVNRARTSTSLGAAGTDDRGNGRDADVRILTVAEAGSRWRDAWTFSEDGTFSAKIALDGHSDIATSNGFFPSTYDYTASPGFGDWFYELMVWDVDNLTQDEDGSDAPTLVTSIELQGNDERRASFESLAALEFDFAAGVHYVITADLGVRSRNGHAVDLFSTARLVDVSLSGAAQLTPLSGHDYIGVQAVPEPETWAALLAGLAMMGGVVRRRRRAE